MKTNMFDKIVKYIKGLFVVSAFFLMEFSCQGIEQQQTNQAQGAVLQGSIHLIPTSDESGKIQPGTNIKVAVTVENKGDSVSQNGSMYLRFALAHPLGAHQTSVIFETEKKPLSAIKPGEKIEIAFESPQKTPSVLDFVRDDWSLREYQAIAVIDDKEYVIGTLALTFSAYYYPTLKKELPIKIPTH